MPSGVLSSDFQRWPSAWRSGLSMLAAGILVFLLVEILGEATSQTALAIRGGTGGVPAR
ncbi:MAG: hypothetical protein ACYDAE_09685 [Steroidobacteraceae bacterium]